ncbi:hypothetical protein [Roseibium album]|uniref:hypothetical protein n=1 Tax=Roseibium album TaxID=311410 RepID=UPI002492D8CA|nr:hypothetical protein [Roseibium album]
MSVPISNQSIRRAFNSVSHSQETRSSKAHIIPVDSLYRRRAEIVITIRCDTTVFVCLLFLLALRRPSMHAERLENTPRTHDD